MPDNTVLTAIKPLQYQGENLLQDKWKHFLEIIQTTLKQSGFEDPASSNELLLYSFNHPFPAITAILSCITAIRNTFNEIAPDTKLPFHVILHLCQPDEIKIPAKNPDAEIWELLKPQIIYITRPLKSNWEVLMAQKQFPACTFKNEGEGLFELKISKDAEIRTETLLPFRSLPVQGDLKECFYCGMKTHQPGACPSKLLTMAFNGLNAVGYLPFDQINMIFKKVFSDQEKILNKLVGDINPTQVRKDPELAVYLAFLDITRAYQVRFLWNMSFSGYMKWEGAFKAEKMTLDNRNMQLGLDCLRVRQYPQAEELLLKECKHKSPKRFYAMIGRAFIALEKGRLADMRTLLSQASDQATQEKERIYVALLLARYYDLYDENWRSKDILRNAIAIKPDCLETNYQKILLDVKGSFTEDAFQQLRTLMTGQKSLFMTMLLDPALIPIQTKVENILITQYHTLTHNAENTLAQARNDLNDLQLWFENDDEQFLANLKTLELLTKRFERKSYFDVYDVEHKSHALLASGKSLREQKLNTLFEQVNKAVAKWTGFHNFWLNYEFPSFFSTFHDRLMPLKNDLQRAQALAKKSQGHTYREAVRLLREVNAAFVRLEPLHNRMNGVSLFIKGVILFAKKIIISEIGLTLLAVLTAFGLDMLPKDTMLSSLTTLTGSPIFQKKALLFISLVLAPFLALSWTIRDLTKA